MANHYVAFMLRLWQVGIGEGALWRASLENPHTGESSALADLAALTVYLESLTRREIVADAADDDLADSPGSESARSV